jgi:hypothetical protein
MIGARSVTRRVLALLGWLFLVQILVVSVAVSMNLLGIISLDDAQERAVLYVGALGGGAVLAWRANR